MSLKKYGTGFLVLGASFAGVVNVLGPGFSKEHWESGFGKHWMPFLGITISQKRLLAGVLELASVFCIVKTERRAIGFGWLMVSLGATVPVHHLLGDTTNMYTSGAVTILAGYLLVEELFFSSKTIKHE